MYKFWKQKNKTNRLRLLCLSRFALNDHGRERLVCRSEMLFTEMLPE